MSSMNALYYNAPRDFEIRKIPIPTPSDDEVLLKVKACGVCGTDGHIHEGEFIATFPLVPGHEVVGEVVEVGKNVTEFVKGDRCVADNTILCDTCIYCRRNTPILCSNLNSRGVTRDGGFAEYIVFHQKKVYKIHNLTDEEATLCEPAACVMHGLDKLDAPVGAEVLLFGAGPTGLLLSQLLKVNGASKVTIAANKGTKMDMARQLNVADVYIDLDRQNPEPQYEQLKKDNPHGFDVVVEATGTEVVAQQALNYVRRGGKLMIYGVYEAKAQVHWPPKKIFEDEITIVGSFAQSHCMPRAVAYLDSGKINVKGMVTDVFKLEDYGKALEKMKSRDCVKIAIKP